MIPNYRTVTISADANENIVPIIYQKLQIDGYSTPNFTLKFIGFEDTADNIVYINKNKVKVPSTGKLYTPYVNSSDFMKINSVTFPTAIVDMDFWIIY